MSEIRQRRSAPSAHASTPGQTAPARPAGAGPGLDPNSQFAGGNSTDLSLGPWLTAVLLVLPCLFIYFQFWPLIKEELDKGESLFGIAPDVKEDLAAFWDALKARLGFT